MGRRRVCGKICHHAKREKCGCWCGGIFHGSKGEQAREAFASEFGGEPKSDQSDTGGERWIRAMQKAREAAA